MTIDEKYEEKNGKDVVFKVDISDQEHQVARNIDDNLIESIFIFAKKFSKVMRILDKILEEKYLF